MGLRAHPSPKASALSSVPGIFDQCPLCQPLLQTQTVYWAWVRPVCGIASLSPWSAQLSYGR